MCTCSHDGPCFSDYIYLSLGTNRKHWLDDGTAAPARVKTLRMLGIPPCPSIYCRVHLLHVLHSAATAFGALGSGRRLTAFPPHGHGHKQDPRWSTATQAQNSGSYTHWGSPRIASGAQQRTKQKVTVAGRTHAVAHKLHRATRGGVNQLSENLVSQDNKILTKY